MSFRFIYIVANGRISFFIRLNNTILTVNTTFYLSMGIYFVSISWLLWKMLQWTWECRYLFEILISVLSDKYPEVELLDHVVVLFLVFCGNSILFSMVAAPIYFPTSSISRFSFLHILDNICYLCLFDDSHPTFRKLRSWHPVLSLHGK